MNSWLVGLVWIAWFVTATGTGYSRTEIGDATDRHATLVSVWADVVMLVSMLAAVAAAIALPAALLPVDPRFTLGLGAGLVIAGLAIRTWSAASLGSYFTRSIVIREGQRVVTSGPYSILRHPGYAGVLLSLVGLALTLDNWLSLLAMMIGFFSGHVPRIRAEEAVLEENIGEPYREFERTRKRLIPGIW